jgi:hypothetical protein
MEGRAPFVKRKTLFDPHRRSAELVAESLKDCPFTALVGFEKEPDSFDSEIKRLGGVVICTQISSADTAFFKLGSRWRRFLFRLELAWRRFTRRWHVRIRNQPKRADGGGGAG